MRPIKNNTLSTHEATSLFLKIFEDYKYIKVLELLNGLNELTGEEVNRKELMFDLKMCNSDTSLVLRGLRNLKLVERRVIKRNVFYKLKKERYQYFKDAYTFISKKLVA